MAEDKTRPKQPRRTRTRLARLAIAIVLLLFVAELFARYALGLGDPPLSMRDPQIEYLWLPSRTYHRFGNTISINSFSMRSGEFPARKTNPHEFRLLLLGDSVINGGALTDQAELASSLVQEELPARISRPIMVGNISAGSWGPANLLAYVERFGTFDADVAIIVLSSQDAGDVPTFASLPADSPDRSPALALQEAFTRYLPRYLPGWLGGLSNEPAPSPSQSQIEESLNALRGLVRKLQASGVSVAVALHPERAELEGAAVPKRRETLAAVAEECGAEIIDLTPSFRDALSGGAQPYRDTIHPNAVGQRLIATAIERWVERRLSEQ